MITSLSQDLDVAFVEPRDPRWVEPALTREFLAGRAMFFLFLCVFALEPCVFAERVRLKQ